MKKILKIMGRTLPLNHLFVRFSGKSLICGFHRVAEPDGSILDQRVERLTPKDFEDVLLYLRSIGYSLVSLGDLLNASDRSRKAVITFDDGFRSVYTHAFPILRKYAIPFTVFLTTAAVGTKRLLWLHRIYASMDRLKPEVVLLSMASCAISVMGNSTLSHNVNNAIYHASPDHLLNLAERLAFAAGLTVDDEARIAYKMYLGIDDIREMMRGGLTVGAHGHEHWCLDSLDEHQTIGEIGKCKDFISSHFDTAPEFYSYAYGKKNRWVDNILQKLSFKGVCTTDAGLVGKASDRLALPRQMGGNDLLNFVTSITKLYVRVPQSSGLMFDKWSFESDNNAISNNVSTWPNVNAEIKKGWVSAIVPTFNRRDLLIAALESIFQQSFRPIEVVVVDDGSSDGTEDVVRDWASVHGEDHFLLKYIRQDNKGANAARNLGIRHALGEFISFLDSDDRWMPKKLEMQMAVLNENSEVSAVYCGLRYVDLETERPLPSSPRLYPAGRILKEMLVHDVTEGTPCWVVRKKCFENVGLFDETLPARQDWDMFIRISAAYTIGCVPEVLVEAGEHQGVRVRSNPMNEIVAHRRIFERYSSMRSQFSFSLRLASRSAMYRRRGRVYFHRGISRKRALSMYLLAILVWPFSFDSYAALTGMMLSSEFRRKIRFSWNRIFGKTRLAIKTH